MIFVICEPIEGVNVPFGWFQDARDRQKALIYVERAILEER